MDFDPCACPGTRASHCTCPPCRAYHTPWQLSCCSPWPPATPAPGLSTLTSSWRPRVAAYPARLPRRPLLLHPGTPAPGNHTRSPYQQLHTASACPPCPPRTPQNGSHFVLIPGPGDPCPGDVLPQPALPSFFTEQLRAVLPKVTFASNPCRCVGAVRDLGLARTSGMWLKRGAGEPLLAAGVACSPPLLAACARVPQPCSRAPPLHQHPPRLNQHALHPTPPPSLRLRVRAGCASSRSRSSCSDTTSSSACAGAASSRPKVSRASLLGLKHP